MTDLDEILEHADYLEQLRHQKEIINITFQDECVFAYGGGLFELTPEFIAGVQVRANGSELWVLDRNRNAIQITNVEQFVTQAVSAYNLAIKNYAEAAAALTVKRSVKAIIQS
jgi:hypothetical protein